MTETIKLCECGCGQPTKMATKTDVRYGHVKGHPLRFIRWHHRCGKFSKVKVNCAQCGKEKKVILSEIAKTNNFFCNRECQSKWVSGKNSHRWKGGITPENIRIRKSIESRLWREAVFARDNWTCQECCKKGGELHIHHIKPFAKYPEFRVAIDNGMTLCKTCHNKKHFTKTQTYPVLKGETT